MVIFHFSFDLNYFGIVRFDIINHPFWYFFPRLIVFLFLFATGISLYLAHYPKIRWKAFLKRLSLLILWAATISLVTYLNFPDSWIYFGTLHAIAVVSIMSLPFLPYPRLSLLIGLALFLPSMLFDLNLPWISLPHASWDYISPFPWVGASLLGLFAAHKGFYQFPLSETSLVKSLKYLGQHSLFIYLVHQPLLFLLLGGILKLKSVLHP